MEQLEVLIDNLPKFIEQYNAKLVIVDSIISLTPGRVLWTRNDSRKRYKDSERCDELRRYADIYNLAVIITNQVVSYPEGSQFGFDYIKLLAGTLIGHGSTYRIFLRKSGKNRVAIMFDSPSQPYQRVKFSISESGIQDVLHIKSEESDSVGSPTL